MAAPVAAMAARSAVWLGGDPVEWVLCPYDVHHRVPRASLERHAASCRLRRMGYSAEEEAEMYDSSFFYGNLKVPSIAMDKDLQFHIVKQARAQSVKEGAGYSEGSYSLLPIEVPQNHKRFTCDLTQADRLALYDYVVEETKKQRSRSQITENDSDLFVDLAAKITQDDSQKGPKSHLEILAEMRDYKRRRQSYRAKNVHITKKSYTEVIRDVIGVHMEELSNQWQEENRLDNSEICEGGKSKSSGSLLSEGRTGGQLRRTRGSQGEAARTRSARDTGETPAGVPVNGGGVAREAKTETLGEKERGMKTSITTIKEESRNNNLMILFVSCSKHNFHKNYCYYCFAQDSKGAHIILVLHHTCAAWRRKSATVCQDGSSVFQIMCKSVTFIHLLINYIDLSCI
ncbi:U11/U12 small nuclear ribonucleoprotein 48 kDa protein isoform X1 [Ammospiza nelsoni]|uniref:U11/U12 small nuclear ribonucleoprotein 48 kDa protein isoform X1 n=1 Tax=Ammospiza nelsoni TaxID=2857394 RepID=UPI002869CCA3|nr:U11/U12 small nuclear ribonucleoprotein 48 kDa protein isoform X1 [Ammospiza nelsoni]